MKCAHKAQVIPFWEEHISNALAKLRDNGLLRSLRVAQSPITTKTVIDGKEVLLFCTNDYLGLATDHRMRKAAMEATRQWGTGSAASRLISGNISLYSEIEKQCAELKKAESALVFSSGYATNVGVIPSLVGPDVLIVSDQLNHASIVDACKLAKAEISVYPHCQIEAVESILKHRSNRGKAVIVTDGVFSMDGDLAPIPQLLDASQKYDALLVVDDAHGTGVLGEGGSGIFDHYGVSPSTTAIQVGTFSKALGSLGGFVACSAQMSHYLINRARSLVYSTALPPSVLAANLESLRILKEDTQRLFQLRKVTQYLKNGINSIGLPIPNHPTPIVPIIIGDSKETVRLSEYLLARGIFIPPIRPPTVPKGHSRLRISLSASHREEDIDRLLYAISSYFRQGA